MGKTKDKPTAAVETLKPYVKRAMEDPDLRDDLVAAFVTARSLYEQIGKKDGVKEKAKRVSDKDFQEDIQDLVADLTTASERLQGKSPKKSHKLRNRVVAVDRRDDRCPLQPVDGARDARVDHGPGLRHATGTGSRSSRTPSRPMRPRWATPPATPPRRPRTPRRTRARYFGFRSRARSSAPGTRPESDAMSSAWSR